MSFVAKSFFFLVVVGLAALLTIQINPTSSTVQLKANDGIFDEANNSIFDEASNSILDEAFDGISNEANDGIFEVPSFDKITPVSNIVLAKMYEECPVSDTELIINGETRQGVYDPKAYYDTKGKKTICYGQNLENTDRKKEIEAFGLNFAQVYAGNIELSKSQCDKMFEKDLAEARKCVKEIYGNNIGCDCARKVLLDMCYNMKTGKMKKWPLMNQAVKEKDWQEVADEAVNSDWCG